MTLAKDFEKGCCCDCCWCSSKVTREWRVLWHLRHYSTVVVWGLFVWRLIMAKTTPPCFIQWMTDYLSLQPKPYIFNLRLRQPGAVPRSHRSGEYSGTTGPSMSLGPVLSRPGTFPGPSRDFPGRDSPAAITTSQQAAGPSASLVIVVYSLLTGRTKAKVHYCIIKSNLTLLMVKGYWHAVCCTAVCSSDTLT